MSTDDTEPEKNSDDTKDINVIGYTSEVILPNKSYLLTPSGTIKFYICG